MMTIRASQAGIVVECGAASQPPVNQIDTSGPEAALGSAVHDCLEDWLNDGQDGAPKPQPGANKHGVDPGTVAELLEFAPDALALIREDLGNLKAEVEIRDDLIRGRIDGLSLTQGQDQLFGAALIDWKTGQSLASNLWQRVAYASAVASQYGMPAQGYIYTAEIWLAKGEIFEARVDQDMIDGFRSRLKERTERGTARPGVHCKYCWRRHECAEHTSWIQSAALEISDIGTKEIAPGQIGLLWDKSRELQSALKAYEQTIDALIAFNDEVAIGDGRKLVFRERKRESIDARAAWPVMIGAGLSQDYINSVLTISKTKLLAIVGKHADRGDKAKAKAAMMAALDAAGAISRNVTQYRAIITADTQTESDDENK